MQDTKNFVEKSIASLNEILEPLAGPKFITELQEGISKLHNSCFDMTEAIL